MIRGEETLSELTEQFDILFVERIWKSIKYEKATCTPNASVSEATASIARYLELYNPLRPHCSPKAKTSDQICINRLPGTMAA